MFSPAPRPEDPAQDDGRRQRVIRAVAVLMVAEAVSLAVSSALHLSGTVTGRKAPFNGTHAGIAEAIIAAVMTAGAATMVASPPRGRRVGIAVNVLAVIGFLNGLSMTVRGGHLPDITYHLVVLVLLVTSIVFLAQGRPATARTST